MDKLGLWLNRLGTIKRARRIVIEEEGVAVLQSTYSDLEIVLVNDGSTDSSKTICENLAQWDSRIFCYTKENGGVVSARNYGVE